MVLIAILLLYFQKDDIHLRKSGIAGGGGKALQLTMCRPVHEVIALKEKRFSSLTAKCKVQRMPGAKLGIDAFVTYRENLDHNASRIL